MSKKSIKFYNLIFPIWILILIPITWIFILPANFFIDLIVVALTMKFMKINDIKKKVKHVITKIWIVGFISDFIGAGAMYLATIISFNNNSNLHEWWQNNIEYAVNYNPFESIYSMVWVTACVMIAAICIYIINYKLCLKKLDINSAQKKKIALSLAVFTAHYLFYIPTALFFK